jgi:hypothetical protein
MARYGLRTYSGPFDWLTMPVTMDDGFQRRINCILNDFNDFWNPKDFKFLPKDPKVFNDEKCDYYENIKTGFYFYHDFPIGIPFEESLPKVKEKYQRRIDRFYREIHKNKRVLLIWFCHCFLTDNNLQMDLCNKICEKFGKQIDFLIIEHNDNLPLGKIEKIEMSQNIAKYNLYTRKWDEKGNPTTMGQEEICGKIFEKYKLSFFTKFKLKILNKKLPFINRKSN